MNFDDLDKALAAGEQPGFAETIDGIFVCYYPGNKYITLDGDFTVDALREVIAFVEKHSTLPKLPE